MYATKRSFLLVFSCYYLLCLFRKVVIRNVAVHWSEWAWIFLAYYNAPLWFSRPNCKIRTYTTLMMMECRSVDTIQSTCCCLRFRPSFSALPESSSPFFLCRPLWRVSAMCYASASERNDLKSLKFKKLAENFNFCDVMINNRGNRGER